MTSSHPYAEIAARAAEVANRMGKGWDMHDALFVLQDEWTAAPDIRAALISIAESSGLDARPFGAALDASSTGEVLDKLKADVRAGEACSVETTPSFFLITPSHVWAAVGPRGLDRLQSDAKYWR